MSVSAYQSPGRNAYIADYDNVMSLNNSIIMAGDLNCKHTNWGCRVNNPNGIKLQTFISSPTYTVSPPDDPIYFPTNSDRQPDILDIVLIKSISFTCMQKPLAKLRPHPGKSINKFVITALLIK